MHEIEKDFIKYFIIISMYINKSDAFGWLKLKEVSEVLAFGHEFDLIDWELKISEE